MKRLKWLRENGFGSFEVLTFYWVDHIWYISLLEWDSKGDTYFCFLSIGSSGVEFCGLVNWWQNRRIR